jgi:anti-anti-sigma factor
MRIERDLTIYTVAELKPVVLAAIAASEHGQLDLSQVTEIDSAGLQLLLLARREAQHAGHKLCLICNAPAVTEVLKLVGLSAMLAATEAA